MRNPFQKNYSDSRDVVLVASALSGNRASLTELIEGHQGFIYNIALKMMNNVEDAKDVTQEVLLKLITNLSQYQAEKGKFRTWLYRITFNHILQLKKQPYEQLVSGFEEFFGFIEASPVQELSTEEEEEMQLFIEESMIACMTGMLMCLNREQRLTYIVGQLFEIDHNLAAEIFEITPANFRQRLSRARKDLHQWMHKKCGLVNKENSCRCPKKTKGFIEKGWVNPANLKWQQEYQLQIKELTDHQLEKALLTVDDLYARLYKEHPFKIPPQAEKIIGDILENDQLAAIFKL